jgi:hypothetical protein
MNKQASGMHIREICSNEDVNLNTISTHPPIISHPDEVGSTLSMNMQRDNLAFTAIARELDVRGEFLDLVHLGSNTIDTFLQIIIDPDRTVNLHLISLGNVSWNRVPSAIPESHRGLNVTGRVLHFLMQYATMKHLDGVRVSSILNPILAQALLRRNYVVDYEQMRRDHQAALARSGERNYNDVNTLSIAALAGHTINRIASTPRPVNNDSYRMLRGLIRDHGSITMKMRI